MSLAALRKIEKQIVSCRKCPRLVAWREKVAEDPPPRFRGETYWARPVPGFGDHEARLLIVGLAPAAHGGNRTGRIFTGDRSGDWLFRALHKFGFANQPVSTAKDDGLALTDCYIAAAVRCAPPLNKPSIDERDTCLPYLASEVAALPRLRVILALGSFAWNGALAALARVGMETPRPKPRFAHGASARVGGIGLIGSFHPSQQNTFTGKLTESAFDDVFRKAKAFLRQRL